MYSYKRQLLQHTEKVRWCDHGGDIGMRWLKPRNASSRQELDQARSRFCLELPEGCGPADILIWAQWCWLWTSGLQNCRRVNFYCFKPSSLWQFVTAATGPNTDNDAVSKSLHHNIVHEDKNQGGVLERAVWAVFGRVCQRSRHWTGFER